MFNQTVEIWSQQTFPHWKRPRKVPRSTDIINRYTPGSHKGIFPVTPRPSTGRACKGQNKWLWSQDVPQPILWFCPFPFYKLGTGWYPLKGTEHMHSKWSREIGHTENIIGQCHQWYKPHHKKWQNRGWWKIGQNRDVLRGGQFLLMIMSLKGATSDYACVWYKIHKIQRWDMTKDLDFYNSGELKRTSQEIRYFHGLKKFCCIHPPCLTLNLTMLFWMNFI